METIQAKVAFAQEQQLKGVMIWSLDQDVLDDRSLLSVIRAGVKPSGDLLITNRARVPKLCLFIWPGLSGSNTRHDTGAGTSATLGSAIE